MVVGRAIVTKRGSYLTMSSESTLKPRKETIYDGPAVEIFTPKTPQDLKAALAGKETIHSGDVPDFIARRLSKSEAIPSSPKIERETVHQGPIPEMFAKLGQIAHDLVMPDRETIYQGPDIRIRQAVDIRHVEAAADGVVGKDGVVAKRETVYDEATFVAKRVDTTAARGLVTRMVQRASVRFFAVAALSFIELYLCREHIVLAASSAAMAVTFSVVGFYTFRLNLKALLLAIALYAATTIFMAVNATMTDHLFEMIVPLFSRGFMIYNLLRTYGLLVDLHLLEAEIY
jgi:hypothetical protein